MYLILLVPPARLERTTPRLGIWCSIHLSYGGEKVILLAEIRKVKLFWSPSNCSFPLEAEDSGEEMD